MWQIAVCDDELTICEQIHTALKNYSSESGEKLNVTFYHSGEELLEKLADEVDILLLDIRMSGLSGVEAARKLREFNRNVLIIFITTMTQYAIEGYSVHAFGFLKKPLDDQQFRLVMSDALRSLRKTKGVTIRIENNGQTELLNSQEIIFIEAFGHSVNARMTCERTIPCFLALSDLESQLARHGFFRVHKSYLVNFDHIKKIEQQELILSDGSRIPLSKHRRKQFRIAFTRYFGEKL